MFNSGTGMTKYTKGTSWDEIRKELPQDVQNRLDEKRKEIIHGVERK